MKTKQVFYCNRCLHKFTLDDGFKNVFYTPEIIIEAVALYVRGLSGRKVSNHMREFREVTVGETTVLRWVRTFGGKIADFDRNMYPRVNGRIHNDEVVLKVKGKKYYSIKAIDSSTSDMTSIFSFWTLRLVYYSSLRQVGIAQRLSSPIPNPINDHLYTNSEVIT
jgi:transposase